jgi:predicted AAA+ superfamily ATPase
MRESGTPLIIDKAQMAPDIFHPLKILIDEQRQEALGSKNRLTIIICWTGSANLMVIPELANAMVGRMATLILLLLSASEVKNTTSHFLERCFQRIFRRSKPTKHR